MSRLGCTAHDPIHNPRAYIAAPIFTPDQLRSVGQVDAMLRGAGYDTYSPSRDGVMLSPKDPAEKRDEVFYSNMLAIRQSDLLVALLDVKDTGTIWELGAAMARELTIIGVTLSTPSMNVMLERGVVAHVCCLDDLTRVATVLRPHLLWGRKSTNDLRASEAELRATLKANYSYSGDTQ